MYKRFALNRWNYYQEEDNWIFPEITENGIKNHYRKEPPEEFIELTMKITQLNDQLVLTKDLEENERIFRQMMKISKRLQQMQMIDD